MNNNAPEPNVGTPAQDIARTESLAVGSPEWWQGVMDSAIPEDPMEMLQQRQHQQRPGSMSVTLEPPPLDVPQTIQAPYEPRQERLPGGSK